MCRVLRVHLTASCRVLGCCVLARSPIHAPRAPPPSLPSSFFLFSPLRPPLSCTQITRTQRIQRTHTHTHTHSGLGIALLAVMAFVVQGGIPAPYATDWRIVAPIFVLRTALINCAQPLRKTMLNDFVPKDQRGRWNSLDSFRRMGWSGRYVVSRQRSNHFTRVQAISWRRCLLSALPSCRFGHRSSQRPSHSHYPHPSHARTPVAHPSHIHAWQCCTGRIPCGHV